MSEDTPGSDGPTERGTPAPRDLEHMVFQLPDETGRSVLHDLRRPPAWRSATPLEAALGTQYALAALRARAVLQAALDADVTRGLDEVEE